MRIAILTASLMLGTAAQPAPPRVPVVLELFTSEGCSSCPPADQVLSKLVREQPVVGAEIIGLGLHVDYWDQLGWKDPASSHDATERQQEYSREFGEDRVYTPQAVIDGRDELVGSDEGGVKRAVAKAARQPHARMTVSASASGDGVVATVAVFDLPDAEKNSSVQGLVFLTEDGITSAVRRGENGGRTLHHDAVVRRIVPVTLTALADRREASVELGHLPPDWHRDRLRVVAVLPDRKSHRIWGAAVAPVR
jgi:hypothetical protein